MLGSDSGKWGKKKQKTNKKRTAHEGEKGKPYKTTINDPFKEETLRKWMWKHTEIQCKKKEINGQGCKLYFPTATGTYGAKG
jgi:hypothetical protein